MTKYVRKDQNLSISQLGHPILLLKKITSKSYRYWQFGGGHTALEAN